MKRGERMKKVIVILLVVGLLIGVSCITADTIKEEPFHETALSDESNTDNPSPCGGGSGNGGGAPD